MIRYVLNRIRKGVGGVWAVYQQQSKAHFTASYETEAAELENIFGLLVLGSFVGMPSPPMAITLDMMPVMEKELIRMLEKVDTASSPLSDLASVFEVG